MPKIKKINAYYDSDWTFFAVNNELYCYEDLFIHFAPDRQWNTYHKSRYKCNYMSNWIEKHFNFIKVDNLEDYYLW